jgi:signal peptidase II
MNLLLKPSILWSFFLGMDVLIFDRLHKYLQIDIAGWTGGEIINVAPFFDYTLVWNTGISYGLMGGMAPEMLLLIMGLAMVALGWWWVKEDSLLTRIGIALAIGGALSNAIDRVVYGAVADFFALSFFPYVFNIADVAISIGVVALIIDVLRSRPQPETKS